MQKRPQWNIKAWLALLLAVAAMAASATAQTTSATLRGTVKDPRGAVVSKAKVTLISERTQAERETSSSSDGAYTFSAVEPGLYTVKVEAGGFKALTQTGVSLSPSDIRALDIALEVGQTTETVTVSGTTEEIKTDTGEKSNTITAKQIENLSILSRSSLELLRILPGVVAPDSSSYAVVSFGDASAYNVNGQRGTNNNVSVDGSRVIDIGCNCGSIVSLNNDFVQEVSIKTSNYSADSGASGVGIIATTKSGGSEYHGSVYTYNRHDALSANDRFRNYLKATDPTSLAAQKPLGRFYYPGGTISGPLLIPKINKDRNKLFFFVGFEYQKQDFSAQPKLSNVPTAAQRTGNFGANSGVKIPGGYANAGQVAPGGNLAPYINPIGKVLLNLYPLPNLNSASNNYVAVPISFQNRKDLKMKFDYRVSDKTNLYVRITREREFADGPYGIWWGPSTFELPTHNLSTNLGRSAAVGMTRIINPTMTNEIVFSGSKLKLDNNYVDPEKVSLKTLGIENIRLPFDNTRFGRQSQYAPLSLISWAQGQLWSPGTNPIFAYNDSFSLNDNLSKVKGTHTMKFGALIEQGNKRQNFQGDPDSQGQLEFNNWNPNGTGNDWGDLLVGQLTGVSHGTQPPIGNYRFYNYEFFAQDSWKLRPNFTLEFGLRAAHMTVNKERKGFDVLFSPQAYKPGAGYYVNGDPFSPNGLLSAARGQIPKGAIDAQPVLWGPRLNFAWDVKKNQRLVVRGGAGVFYNRVQGNFQYDPSLRSAPNGNVGASIGLFDTIPGTTKNFNDLGGLTISNMGIVNVDGKLIPVDPLKLAKGGGQIISPNLESNRIPQTYTTSLSIATRLPLSAVLETSYVGTFGRHLPSRRQINFVPVGALLKGTVPGDKPVEITTLRNPGCDPGAVDANGVVTRRGNCEIVTSTVSSNLANPLNRAALDAAAINKFRPFSDLGNVRYNEYNATSNYHSLQVTLSRQTGKNLQFFGTYTFSKVLGLTTGEFADLDPIDARGRSYGVLNFDRTHVFNLSYNYNIPNLSPVNNAFAKGVLNGWQLSGITTFASGTPLRLRFTGDITGDGLAIASFGTNAFPNDGNGAGSIAPIYTANPARSGDKVGDKVFDLASITIPGFGQSGSLVPPFYHRTPATANWDVSFFKNFKISEKKNLQFRTGFFNIFNQAYPKRISTSNNNDSDIYLTLETKCTRTPTVPVLVLPNGTVVNDYKDTIPNGVGGTVSGICDPTKPFTFTDATKNNFGKILTKRGQRVVELALKFTF
ncbi:MAG: TonB-dependent receptor [Acidobacteria bacterium]|nr:TonB-dependent receptor [Acidobacteriota bacterium]MBI3425697.1 TonB-dependent receptor [Acidobacteriota bacterium]